MIDFESLCYLTNRVSKFLDRVPEIDEFTGEIRDPWTWAVIGQFNESGSHIDHQKFTEAEERRLRFIRVLKEILGIKEVKEEPKKKFFGKFLKRHNK